MNCWKKALLLVLSNLSAIIITVAQDQAQPIVDVAAIPEKTQVSMNDTLNVVIQIQAGKQLVAGATANLTFDPSLLKVIKTIPGKTLETEVVYKSDNDKGNVIYSAGTFNKPPAGTFDLTTVLFKVIGNTKAITLSFDTSTGNVEKTDVAFYGATSVLNTTHPATVTIKANNPPIADAGADVILVDTDGDGKEKVKLDASASKDNDGSITSYVWKVGSKVIAREIYPELDFSKGQTKVTLEVMDGQGATDTDEVTVTINEPDNIAPVAEAGEDQILADTDRNGKEEVQFNGLESSDEDGNIASYHWSIEGEEVASGAEPKIELSVGETTIILTVTDNKGLSSTDAVIITVNTPANQGPIANAGEDLFVTDENEDGFEEVRLDGSGSKDSDGTIVDYRWKWHLGSITGKQPIVKLPHGESAIVLTVTDNDSAEATDTVMVTIRLPHQSPHAHAGEDMIVEDKGNDGKEKVVLDGSGSIKGSHAIASYTWTTAEDEISTGMQSTVELPVGVTTITLTVTDSEGITSKDEVKVTVVAYTNIAPIAHAGDNQTVIDEDRNGEAEISLDGSASKDEDGIIQTYAWTYEGLDGFIVGIKPTVTLPIGTTEIILTVTDDRGETGKDTVSITIEPKNEVPVANAGEDQEVIDKDGDGQELIMLDGSASKDHDGNIISFDWYSSEGQKITSGKAVHATFSIGIAKIYLVVMDDQGAQDTAFVTKSVTAPLGIDETKKELADIVIFPNPSDSYFTLSSRIHHSSNFYIIDAQGKIVKEDKMYKGKAIFDLSLYPKGIYYLTIEIKGKQLTQRLIVQ